MKAHNTNIHRADERDNNGEECASSGGMIRLICEDEDEADGEEGVVATTNNSNCGSLVPTRLIIFWLVLSFFFNDHGDGNNSEDVA